MHLILLKPESRYLKDQAYFAYFLTCHYHSFHTQVYTKYARAEFHLPLHSARVLHSLSLRWGEAKGQKTSATLRWLPSSRELGMISNLNIYWVSRYLWTNTSDKHAEQMRNTDYIAWNIKNDRKLVLDLKHIILFSLVQIYTKSTIYLHNCSLGMNAKLVIY